MKIFILLFMFLFLGAFFIISNENLSLRESSDFNRFGEEYYNWLGDLFEGAKGISAYVVKNDWLPSIESDDVISR